MLQEKLRDAEKILDSIKLPGHDIGLVESGFVVKLRISRDGEYLGVYVDLQGFTPNCLFGSTLSEWALEPVLEEAGRRLVEYGFREVYFIDARSDKIIVLKNTPHKLSL
jgi:hypothetical protein